MAEKVFGNRGLGRKPGVPNRTTKSVREAFERAFLMLQEDATHPASLDEWSKRNPAAFYQLAARLIPAQVALSVEGALAEKLIAARVRTLKPDDLA